MLRLMNSRKDSDPTNRKERMELKVRVSSGNAPRTPWLDLPLTFEDGRAFLIWDCAGVGDYELQARIELDPKLLRKSRDRLVTYSYAGTLVLPRPQDN